jgi:hypothetical protein
MMTIPTVDMRYYSEVYDGHDLRGLEVHGIWRYSHHAL